MREHFARQSAAGLTSITFHLTGAALLLWLGGSRPVQEAVRQSVRLNSPALDLAPVRIASKPGSGGGGGDNSPLPASKGRLPRAAARQFTPPAAVVNNLSPKLIMEPTVIAASDAALPQVNMAEYGDPFGRIGPKSNGPGSGGGIGDGRNGGVGPGDGPGVGPGKGGGYSGPVYPIGGRVSGPILIHKVEPEYSDAARKAKVQGTVDIDVIIDENGRIVATEITSSPGMGLEEKALEAVRQWRFKPGTRDGKAVAVSAAVAVNFRLL